MTVRQHKRVLAYVNRLRAKLGEPALDALPAGVLHRSKSCPIARALPGLVYVNANCIDVYDPDDRRLLTVQCPAYIETWIKRFDAGEYPELIA